MEMLKLGLVFAAMVVVLWFKKPLFLSMAAAILATWALFQIPAGDFFITLFNSAVSIQTLSVLLLFYLITYLQSLLERRGSLDLARAALDGLFQSRRVTASLAPVFLGLLPSVGVMPLCGDIVEKSAGDSLNLEEKAFVTSFYRHIPECVLPTFSSVFIPLSLTQGVVKIGAYMVGMLPLVLVLFVLGYVFYLRKIPKDIDTPPSKSKTLYVLDLVKGIWPIALVIVLILSLDIPVYIAVAASLALFIFTGRFKISELVPTLKSAFDKRLLSSMFCIMLFKDVLTFTGVIGRLPETFAKLPIPEILIFALIFFVGSLISGSQAIGVLAIPLAFSTIPGAALSQYILLTGFAFAANQISPTHICVAIAAEHFNIGFGGIVRKTLPVMAVFCAVLVGYYYILLLF